MRPDERMCVGVNSLNMDWYLRFWAGWDEEEWSLVTYFDVTVPEELVVRIERDLLPLLPITLAQEDAASHYEMIKHAIFM
jgi:hypothetical protein